MRWNFIWSPPGVGVATVGKIIRRSNLIKLEMWQARERVSERSRRRRSEKKKNVQMEKTTNSPTNRSGNKKQTQTKERNIIFLYIYIQDSSRADRRKSNIRGETNNQLGWGAAADRKLKSQHPVWKKIHTHTPNFDVLSFLPENTAVCVCVFFFTFVFLFSPNKERGPRPLTLQRPLRWKPVCAQ